MSDQGVRPRMTVSEEVIGVSRRFGTPVRTFRMDTGTGFAAVVCSYGASLLELWVPDRNGRHENVVVRLANLDELESADGYIGATMGRFARIIAGGRITIDGVEHTLDRNYLDHHMHGGSYGFDKSVWSVASGADDESVWVRMTHLSPENDQGYPGEVRASTLFRLTLPCSLHIEHMATTTAPTVVGMTTHAYWNLAGGGTIDEHLLQLAADRVIVTDDEFVPLGSPASVTGTDTDYRSLRAIGNHRLDHCYAIADGAAVLELHDPSSGRTVRVRTDQPGLALYSGDWIIRPRSGLCIQTGDWPDAPNRPEFPSSLLRPKDQYLSRTWYEFSLP